MITSNINELQFKANIEKDRIDNKKSDFSDNLKIDDKEIQTSRTNALTYENIKGISLEEIEQIFKNEDDINMAKNLRLATMFTSDNTLGQALFNTVLGQPFELGYTYLSDRFQDKHDYFSSSANKSLASLLHESLTNRDTNEKKNPTDVISQEKLDEILLEINSYSFLDAMRNTSKDQYDRYKDEDNDYSFLYNDYNLQYQELMQKYKNLEEKKNNIISQF